MIYEGGDYKTLYTFVRENGKRMTLLPQNDEFNPRDCYVFIDSNLIYLSMYGRIVHVDIYEIEEEYTKSYPDNVYYIKDLSLNDAVVPAYRILVIMDGKYVYLSDNEWKSTGSEKKIRLSKHNDKDVLIAFEHSISSKSVDNVMSIYYDGEFIPFERGRRNYMLLNDRGSEKIFMGTSAWRSRSNDRPCDGAYQYCLIDTKDMTYTVLEQWTLKDMDFRNPRKVTSNTIKLGDFNYEKGTTFNILG